jgi:anaerobic selenocysteine-containing dehydrogenase
LLYPLKRSGKKGSGKFERISWDDALAEIANRFGDIDREHGANRIYHTHYTGTCSAIAGQFPKRFFDHIGATEVDPDTICNAAGHTALSYVFGNSVSGFDPRTSRDSKCILIWGANPAHCGPHVYQHWLREHGAKVIVIDPVRTETATSADLHLQVRPGADAALAFSMLHIMREESLVDENYIKNHVQGYEEVLPSIENCTPEWGQSETGIPTTLIEQAARLYAHGPSLLWLGQGLQRQPQGGNVFRACAMLPAPGFPILPVIAGNIAHLDMTPRQMVGLRPLPGWSQYRTPINRLYLCGAGTWPGGTETGIPGHNASQQVLNDLNRSGRTASAVSA